MPRIRISLVFLAVALLLGACGSSDEESGSKNDAGGSASADIGALSIEREDSAAVTETIGVDGGRMTAKAGDGTSFELTVPAGAFAGDTEVTATPAELAGTDIPTSMVMFEPTGTFLYGFATLEITPPDEVPADEQLYFGIDDEGKEITVAPVDPGDTSTTLLIGHFSGYGLARVTDPQRAALLERGASDAEARIQSQMAEALGQERTAQLLGGESGLDLVALFTAASEEYQREVIGPRLEAAGASCAATQKAVETVLGFERTWQLLGMEEAPGFDATEVLMSALADGGPCEEEAIAACKQNKDPSIYIRFMLGKDRMRQLLGGDPAFASLEGLIEKAKKTCLGQAYSASGGGGRIVISGTVEDLEAPFTLNGEFEGGTATLSFTPSDENGGSYTYSGGGSGVTVSGGGTYSISGTPGEVLTLEYSGNGCTAPVGACSPTSAVVTLTPIT